MKYSYIRFGKGKNTILFLHGLGGEKEVAKTLLKNLINKYQIISLDLPGHNETGIKTTVSKNIVNYVSKFIDNLETDFISIVGFSIGGLISLNFINHPKVRKVVIWSSPISIIKPKLTINAKVGAQILKLIPRKVYSLSPTNINHFLKPIGLYFNQNNILAFSKFNKKYINIYLALTKQPLEKINNNKVLAVYADQDILVGKLTSQEQEKLFTLGYQVRIIRNGGHFGTKQGFKKVNEKIDIFLRK